MYIEFRGHESLKINIDVSCMNHFDMRQVWRPICLCEISHWVHITDECLRLSALLRVFKKFISN